MSIELLGIKRGKLSKTYKKYEFFERIACFFSREIRSNLELITRIALYLKSDQSNLLFIALLALYQKSNDESNSHLLFLQKEVKRTIRSLKKSERDVHSFLSKKVICMKNQRVNSQPWLQCYPEWKREQQSLRSVSNQTNSYTANQL